MLISVMLVPACVSGDSLDVVLRTLDRVIGDHQRYDDIRLARINILREKAQTLPRVSVEMYDNNRLLYNEYSQWSCDSAIVCLDRNLAIATALGDSDRVCESTLMLSNLMGSSGMYKEASGILKQVDRRQIPQYLMVLYYETCEKLYSELAYSTQYASAASHYRTLSSLYLDSLEALLPKDSAKYLTLRENRLRDGGMLAQSLQMNDDRIAAYSPGSPEYAMATFHRAVTYRMMGDPYNYKISLAQSAISDISSAINYHASLWMLAEQLFTDGEVAKAHAYMRFSWDRTIAHNTLQRKVQSSSLLSVIDATYQSMMERRNNSLTIFTIIVSVLSVLLVAALISARS